MKKQIIEIAEYDGWKKDGAWFHKKGRWVLVDEYINNLNELHRVALDVWSRLPHGKLADAILLSFLERPVRGCYTHLIKSVYDGIVYLKSQNP